MTRPARSPRQHPRSSRKRSTGWATPSKRATMHCWVKTGCWARSPRRSTRCSARWSARTVSSATEVAETLTINATGTTGRRFRAFGTVQPIVKRVGSVEDRLAFHEELVERLLNGLAHLVGDVEDEHRVVGGELVVFVSADRLAELEQPLRWQRHQTEWAQQ